MGKSEDIVRLVCPLDDINRGEEWVPIPADLGASFTVVVTLDRECRQLNPVVVEAEVQALIFENVVEGSAIIYTDGSVTRRIKSAWAFTVEVNGKVVKESSGAFAGTTSSLTMEILAATKALEWLERQSFTQFLVIQ